MLEQRLLTSAADRTDAHPSATVTTTLPSAATDTPEINCLLAQHELGGAARTYPRKMARFGSGRVGTGEP